MNKNFEDDDLFELSCVPPYSFKEDSGINEKSTKDCLEFIANKHEKRRMFGTLEQNIGYIFNNRGYLAKALTTKSWVSDNPQYLMLNIDYRPLNTLGDGVIDTIFMEEGFKNGINTKGDLTDNKKRFANKETQCNVANSLNLSNLVMWGKGQIQQGLPFNSQFKIFSDLFEAVIGAVFIDGGYESAKQVLLKIRKLFV